MPWLTRTGLQRVLGSFVAAELGRSRRGPASRVKALQADPAWPESLVIGEEEAPSLGLDSIERLWLAAAVNEMFCLYDSNVETALLSAKTFGEWIDIVESGWNQGGHRITFSTSGSSGAPKRCTHTMRHLEREVDYLAERLAGTQRIVALAPSHHIYGFLFTALLPAHMNVDVFAAELSAPGTLTRELRSGDLIVSTPLWWEWLARSVDTLPKGVQGICSTAPCPERLKLELLGKGLQSFTEVYGSSETAGVGLRTYPEDRYTLMPHWTWTHDREGEAMIQNSLGQAIRLQDHLDIGLDGTFALKGRVDGAVQVGGVNVFPAQIEERLCLVPGVREAAVRLSTDGGAQRLKAFVVPDKSIREEDLAQSLQLWSKGFPAPERVRSFTFGPELPRSAMGKLTDWMTQPDKRQA